MNKAPFLPLYGSVGYRDAMLDDGLSQVKEWDVVIIGGGITGAGILRECERRGLRALLVEKHDFAWGTSSKSSKMVHGGLRYLASGQLALTRDSVRERQRLLEEAPGLVDPLAFVMPHYDGQFPSGFLFNRVLDVYDLMAGHRNHRRFPARDVMYLAPGLREDGLRGLTQYGDAVTDDSRLVLRVLQEATASGRCHALNYLQAENLQREGGGVRGLDLVDQIIGQRIQLRTRVVINAAGAWTDELRKMQGGEAQIRPLRGSHLVISAARFPVGYSVSFFHPSDKRPVFIFPWEGTTVIGTTDLDHRQDMSKDACITEEELRYLLAGIQWAFPTLKLGPEDVVSTWSGIRPVVSSGARDPSKEKREHSVWNDRGLISVAGGKLTTFRLIAQDTLDAAAAELEGRGHGKAALKADKGQIFAPSPCDFGAYPLSPSAQRRLVGRFGPRALDVVLADKQAETVAATKTLWAEIHWSLQHEQVCHLDDLLLRRTRLGLTLPQGASQLFERLKGLCMSRLGWDEAHWERELTRYQALYRREYSLPASESPEARS